MGNDTQDYAWGLLARDSASIRVTVTALDTDFTIIIAAAGKVIYLFDTVTNTNGNGTFEVDLWDGPSANGLRAGVLMSSMTAAPASGVQTAVEWDGHGRQFMSGNALIGTLHLGAVPQTVFGTYGFTQQ